ncbi:FmdB family zinc ribbon protein [Argonema antarcticum]|uniref:FmdB family zinc ribbon protein n=1 Tax=Argonema antarcticum TaxID=2942763 RepID=UPI002010E771|nr:zinc ribbon domain-containing protein [Argonema antarcticum]MCL1474931.1 zinc ribbon domain-containing protein [Argonema antarcticum A004/B2]
MPLYEFRCENCGTFEELRSMSEASEPMLCPICQTTAKRIYSVAGLIMTPYSLSSRIEQSAEPRVVNRSESKKPQTHKHHHHHDRPWMIGH